MLTYPHIFQLVRFHAIAGFMAKIMSYIIVIAWAFRDLFIINISMAFTEPFRQINRELALSQGQAMTPQFYWKHRCRYMRVRAAVATFDDSISAITMLALAENIFNVCAHLFKSI
jgi:hypothetical protein